MAPTHVTVLSLVLASSATRKPGGKLDDLDDHFPSAMASKRALSSIPNLARLASPAAARTPASRALLPQPRRIPVSIPSTITSIRLAHGIPRPRNPSPFQQQPQQPQDPQQPDTPEKTTPPPPSSPRPNVAQQPHYELTFTCNPCGTRSRHRVSKQGYHHGSVLIACPGCSNRHVISDHLQLFGDTARTVEDILRDKGELVKKGTLGEEGDVEFWDDGTSTAREPWEEKQRGEQQQGEQLPPGATFKAVKPGEKGGEGGV